MPKSTPTMLVFDQAEVAELVEDGYLVANQRQSSNDAVYLNALELRELLQFAVTNGLPGDLGADAERLLKLATDHGKFTLDPPKEPELTSEPAFDESIVVLRDHGQLQSIMINSDRVEALLRSIVGESDPEASHSVQLYEEEATALLAQIDQIKGAGSPTGS